MKTKDRLRINISTIPESGTEIAGELRPLIFDIAEDERLRCPNPLRYRLTARIVEHSVLIEGTVDTTLECQCDRCLQLYGNPVSNHKVCHHVAIPEDKIIDLTAEVREDILIEFPQKFICAEECAGLCPTCGVNLNEARCDCVAAGRQSDVWSQLDSLKFG